MDLSPETIYQYFQENNLDKSSIADLLITLIENSNSDNDREKYIELLGHISVNNYKCFKFLENLLISDSSEKIRNAAAIMLRDNFLNKALIPMKFALKHETFYDCVITIINTFEKINTIESKLILINEIKKIMKKNYIDENKQYNNRKFKKSLKQLFKVKKIKLLKSKELAEILVNFKTISALINKFYTIFFEIENGLVISLDLSEIGWSVNTWKQKYVDWVQDLSEIIGLRNLTCLKTLDLSNNRINNVKDLSNLKSISDLKIARNKIVDVENLKYFKEIPSLRYLDISGNRIAKQAQNFDFGNINVKLKQLFF